MVTNATSMEVNFMNVIHYPNLRSFMKRHNITIGDIANVIGKSYPATHQKITKKTTEHGKTAIFDIEEARSIILFIIETETSYLKQKYGEKWQDEWNARWGHIENWFEYIFFDEVVTYATKEAI